MYKIRIGFLTLFTSFLYAGSAFSQMPPAITITPADASAWDPLTLTYDPVKGCTPSGKGSLVDAPKVQMHSACFYLEYIDSWGSSWGQTTIDYNATPKDGSHTTTDLTPNGDGTYSITFVPGNYYGAPQGSIIIGLTMVFNNGSWASEGKDPSRGGCGDFYVPLTYNPGLFVQFTQPEESSLFVNLNDSIQIEAVGNESDSIFLYLDDMLIQSTDNDTLIHTVYVTAMGGHWIRTTAKNDTDQKSDSIFYFVSDEVATENLPGGALEGINYINDTTVTMVLFAPDKEFIYLLGDFNDWSVDNDYLLKRTPDENYYWITLDSLLPDTFYRYQFYIDGKIKVGDPYAEMVLDPNNDPYIPSETYPGKIDYPTGKTHDLVTVFYTSPGFYDWNTTDFTPPENGELVIYELLIRDFLADHSYKTLIDTLHYLEYLGVNAIELMPVNEFEGNLSWGYNPSYYFAPDKYYGPKKELQRFIDTCHARGIAVIIDMVLNHSFGQSPMVRMYWDVNRPAANNPWFNQVPKHDYNVGFDFNHENEATQRFVDRVNKFWLSEYKVDGFRFDLSKGFTQKNTLGDVAAWGNYDATRVALWKQYADSIWSVNPDAYVILEHFADNSEEKVLASYGMMTWGKMTEPYLRAAQGWNYNDMSNLSWGVYKTRGFEKPHLVTYMESHDEERQMYELFDWGNHKNPNYIIRGNHALSTLRAELAAAFFFTIPGPKMVWQFGELGYDYSINYDCRVCNKPIRWDYYDDPNRQRLYQAYSSLIRLKRENEAFNSDNFTIDVVDTIKTIHIEDPSMDVTVFGNFDTWPQTIDPAFTQSGTWYDYFTGDSLIVTDVNMPITLEQSEYHIYTTKKLATPDIISAPVALDVQVIGALGLGGMVNGDYRYYDQNGDPEGESRFQWYRGLYENGTNKETIDGATELSYTITTDDWGHYLFFEVTPVAQTGIILEGIPKYAVMDVATAIESEVLDNTIRIYPNPSSGQFNIRIPAGANRTELAIFDLYGKLIYEDQLPADQDNKLIEGFSSGIYLIRISKGEDVFTERIIVL